MNRKYLIIPEFEQLEKTMELAQEYRLGFEYNDFCNPKVYCDEEEIDRRCNTYLRLKRDRSEDTMHGVFLDMVVTSKDPEIRRYCREKAEQSLIIGNKLGVKGVVFHSGLIAELQTQPYLESWLNESEAFWRTMAGRYPNLTIYMENTFEKTPDMLLQLKVNMKDVENFKLCLDYGHACLTPTPITEWTERMGSWTGHIHLNDHDLKADLHFVPGDGKIDLIQCRDLLEKYLPDVPVLLELNGIEKQNRAVEYMMQL